MRIHHGLPSESLGPAALTVGSFDGVHLGHKAVTAKLVTEARHRDSAAVLVTFEPHPRCVLDPANCPKSITTLDEKLALIGPLGVEHVVVMTFTAQLAQQPAEDFMAAVRRTLELRVLVAGRDFALGHRRQGDLAWLRTYAVQHDFEVAVVEPVSWDGRELHSTEIRRLVTLGEVEAANRLLGREFAISGRVEPGDQIGRRLGFPTANLAVEPNKLIPGGGIYAGWVRSPAGVHQAALSIGYRPTFQGTQLRVEAYLLDFEGDLYQQLLEVLFVARLRDEVRYSTPDALADQIGRDVETTRRLLGPG